MEGTKQMLLRNSYLLRIPGGSHDGEISCVLFE